MAGMNPCSVCQMGGNEILGVHCKVQSDRQMVCMILYRSRIGRHLSSTKTLMNSCLEDDIKLCLLLSVALYDKQSFMVLCLILCLAYQISFQMVLLLHLQCMHRKLT